MRVKSMSMFLKLAYNDQLAEFANTVICTFVE